LSVNNPWKKRQQQVYSYLEENRIDFAVIEDSEWRRNASLKYLSDMPGDSLLFLFRRGHSLLVPWDSIMAERVARVDQIIPFTDFDRKFLTAVEAVTEKEHLSRGTIELLSATPYPVYKEMEERLPEAKLLCREEGIHKKILSLRHVKDESEQALYTEIAETTDLLIDDLEKQLMSGSLTTEADIALFLEKRSREAGCDGLGFETIAAGPERSFAIHAVPSYSGALITGRGFTIVDFGVSKAGYTSDVTVTIARGNLSGRQTQMLEAVKEAYSIAADMIGPSMPASAPADAVNEFFSSKGYTMPHSLGHGIGLDTHENPVLRAGEEDSPELKPGMVVTIEPGLYDSEAGGIRLEDDYLITAKGSRRLTNSRILHIPDKK